MPGNAEAEGRVRELASNHHSRVSSFPPLLWAGTLFLLVFVWMFHPVLTGASSIVHGDALSVSLSLQSLLSAALEKGTFPLWSDQLYGGHPIFAEAQGGFANPVNLLLFGLLDPVYAHGLFHFLCGLVGALGCYALCRSLGYGFGPSLFGALALATSQVWLGLTSNATIAGAVALAPFALVAFEAWWRRPDLLRALFLALTVALVILSGYPQAAHGLVLYMAVCVAGRCLNAETLRRPSALRAHVGTGALAAALALGLAAVQLLPLFELVAESIRAEGIDVMALPPPSWFYRGFLFSASELDAMLVPGVGSLLVTSVAAAALLARPRPALLGHLLAAAVLLQLAMAEYSGLYRLLHHRLPGLDSFRTTHLYLTMALPGVAVLAAAGADLLARSEALGRLRVAFLAGLASALAISGCLLQNHRTSGASIAFASLAWVLVAGLLLLRRQRAVPLLLVVILLAEIQWIRIPLLGFAPSQLLRTPPATVGYLLGREAEDRRAADRDFKLANVPHLFSYLGFAPANAENLEFLLRLYLAGIEPAGNLIWGLSSMHANLALPLARRHAVEELLTDEVQGRSARTPGRRFIDVLGVRFVLVHRSHRRGGDDWRYSPDLEEVFYDEASHYYILENPHSLPRLQFHSAPAWVRDVGEAVELLRQAGAPTLILEDPARAERAPPESSAGASPFPRAKLRPLTSSPERYEVEVEASEPGFLFLADANYPGWGARVDGETTPVYSANALGKAVPVSAGSHRVELFFRSKSFRLGLWSSLATSGLVVLCLFMGCWRERVTAKEARAGARRDSRPREAPEEIQ